MGLSTNENLYIVADAVHVYHSNMSKDCVRARARVLVVAAAMLCHCLDVSLYRLIEIKIVSIFIFCNLPHIPSVKQCHGLRLLRNKDHLVVGFYCYLKCTRQCTDGA